MRPILRAVPVLVLLVPRLAGASDPNSIYTVPAKVEILPDEATGARVVIHGAFFFLSAPMSFAYGQPRCGYMSFQCPAGQEAMCRLQWQDLRRSIGGVTCAGFGTLGTVSSATLHAEPVTAVKPDVWDLGMGISQGSYVDGKCGPARTLTCALAAADAGPPDTAPDAAASPDSAPPPPDLAEADAPLPPDGPVLAADAAVAPQPAKPSGCAFAGTGGLFPLLIAFLALARRPRR
jgi:hypothetical protein